MSSINLIFSKVQMVRSVTLCLTCWVSKSQWLPLDGPCLKTSSGHNWFWTSDLMFSKLTDNALNYQYEPFFIYNIYDLTNQQNLISFKVRNRTTNCIWRAIAHEHDEYIYSWNVDFTKSMTNWCPQVNETKYKTPLQY